MCIKSELKNFPGDCEVPYFNSKLTCHSNFMWCIPLNVIDVVVHKMKRNLFFKSK